MPNVEPLGANHWSKVRPLAELPIYSDLVPNGPGNYVLYELLHESAIKLPLYVGRSDQLRYSLLDHLSGNDPNGGITCRTRYCGFSFRPAHIGTTQGIQQYLLDLYRPRCNVTDPRVNAIEVSDLPTGWEDKQQAATPV
jgi:hypothetical protein